MDDSSVLELIPAYMLGALDESERGHVEALLARSEVARQVLLEYEQMLSGLALTVPARQAPPGSTDAFMARLQAPEASMPQATPTHAPGQITAVNVQRGPVRRRVSGWMLLAAAFVVVLAGIGLWRLSLGSTSGTLATINAIKSNPAVRVIALKPADPSASNTLNVVVYGTPDGTDAVIDRKALPALPSGKQYQMWMIPNGQSPVGLPAFDPAPSNQPDKM